MRYALNAEIVLSFVRTASMTRKIRRPPLSFSPLAVFRGVTVAVIFVRPVPLSMLATTQVGSRLTAKKMKLQGAVVIAKEDPAVDETKTTKKEAIEKRKERERQRQLEEQRIKEKNRQFRIKTGAVA